MNRHDLDAFLEQFNSEYRSETPDIRRDRSPGTSRSAGTGWRSSRVRPISFERRSTAKPSGPSGRTRTDGTELAQRGVIVMGIPEDRIEWGRIYLKPVRTEENAT